MRSRSASDGTHTQGAVAVGALLGAALGFAIAPRDAGEGGSLGPEVQLGAAVLVGGLGTGVGALVAIGTASEQWEAVPISAASAPVARGWSEGASFR
jgi:hypothetical protein